MTNQREIGKIAEDLFSKELRHYNITCQFVDDWYDFLVNNLHRVEVKSCQISCPRNTRAPMIGKFQFNKEEQRTNIANQGCWIAFYIIHHDQHIFLGLIRSKHLALGTRKSISIHEVIAYKPIGFIDWMNRL